MRVRHLLAAVAAGAMTMSLTGALTWGTANAADSPARDGLSTRTAAASCWAIKQSYPTAASGLYWLQTPALIAPQQFSCDMVTDGGGWVLVGRGRDGWTFGDNGQGSAATLRSVTTGPAAFAPAALPTKTINGLLNGAGTDTLTDGIRIRRAANLDGSVFQEMRYKVAAGQGGWSWALGGGVKLDSVLLDTDATGPAPATLYNYAGLTTRDFRGATGKSDDLTRAWTFQDIAHNYRAGFSYGTSVGGLNDTTSYLWEYTTENKALPFAQIWLRPQLTDPTYTAPVDSGDAAQTPSKLLSNKTGSTPWGVTGVVGNGSGEQNIEVQALAPIGDTIYVGGKFQYVQKGATPGAGEKVEQSYLAAFDVRTGEWKSGFRPLLNGQVWDIQGLADGRLVVGGEFTTVNGAASPGIAALDPATGALLTSFPVKLKPSAAGVAVKARALDLQGNWLYIGGNFGIVEGGIGTTRFGSVKLRNAARVQVTDGKPDYKWAPKFNSGIMELDASSQGDRVYLVGNFSPDADQNYIQANAFAAITTPTDFGPGTLVPGFKQYLPSNTRAGKMYQQTVKEVGGSVWVGGAEHILGKYDRNTFDRQKSFITRSGGDLQTAIEIDGVVYAGCHCDRFVYTDGTTYDGTNAMTPVYTRVDPIFWIGAFDAATGAALPSFAIDGLRSRAGNGPWELERDQYGCMWFGGDFNRGTGGWIGGFSKVCANDTTAPAAPGQVTGGAQGQTLRAVRAPNGLDVNLTWGASTDNVAITGYEVIRNDRVYVSPNATTLKYTDSGAPAGTKYWVRAIDAAGNRSATTAVVVAP